MSKIIDAEDMLAEAQGCIECVLIAASELPIDDRNPIHTVADIADRKIIEAIALLKEYRNAGGGYEEARAVGSWPAKRNTMKGKSHERPRGQYWENRACLGPAQTRRLG